MNTPWNTVWPHEATDRIHEMQGQLAAKELECQRLRECERDREVFARWMAEALLTLGTLTDEDSEDGGESLRLLMQRGQRLVDAVLRPNVRGETGPTARTGT